MCTHIVKQMDKLYPKSYRPNWVYTITINSSPSCGPIMKINIWWIEFTSRKWGGWYDIQSYRVCSIGYACERDDGSRDVGQIHGARGKSTARAIPWKRDGGFGWGRGDDEGWLHSYFLLSMYFSIGILAVDNVNKCSLLECARLLAATRTRITKTKTQLPWYG